MNGHNGTGVYCSCCDVEKLAELRPHEGLVIKDGRHGQHHVAVVPCREVIERLAGTVGEEPITQFIRRLYI